MHQLKAETQTLDAAYAEIKELYETGIIKPNSIILVTTTNAKFPDFDGFIVYCKPTADVGHKRKSMEDDLDIYGIQEKQGRGLPKYNAPVWMKTAFLLRGLASGTAFKRDKWICMNEADTKKLLGFSLGVLYPESWPTVAVPDGFD